MRGCRNFLLPGVAHAALPCSDSAAYLAFHAEASGFPVPAVKASVALSNLPAQAYPEQGLHLISEAKRFLLNEKLVRKDFSVESWKIPGFS